MIRFAIAILLLLCLVPAAAAQDDSPELPKCTIPIAEIKDASLHLRNIKERLDNLTELFEDIQADGIDEDAIYDLMYWAVMADNSVDLNKEIMYPDCSEYSVLSDTFKEIIADMYAIYAQTNILYENKLSDYQVDRVSTLLKANIQKIQIGQALWFFIYEQAQAI